jgi:transposase-like protein
MENHRESEVESELAQELLALIPSKRDKRWRCPVELRSRVVTYARSCRDKGEAVADIAVRLGLIESTLARWLRRAENETSPGFRSVSIVPSDSGSFPETSPHLTLITPQGYRVEGLDLASAAELLRSLG